MRNQSAVHPCTDARPGGGTKARVSEQRPVQYTRIQQESMYIVPGLRNQEAVQRTRVAIPGGGTVLLHEGVGIDEEKADSALPCLLLEVPLAVPPPIPLPQLHIQLQSPSHTFKFTTTAPLPHLHIWLQCPSLTPLRSAPIPLSHTSTFGCNSVSLYFTCGCNPTLSPRRCSFSHTSTFSCNAPLPHLPGRYRHCNNPKL